MFKGMLRHMQEMVRTSRYVMTVHGADEMEADGLTVYDVERCVLTGRIVQRQRDRVTGEWKYLVQGQTLGGDSAVVVGRIGPTGKLVVITVYVL